MTMVFALIIVLILPVPSIGQIWIARYNGPANGYDKAEAIAVDGSGNVYVTGTSWGSGTFYDYATVKYSPAGDSLWVARYNGPDNMYDEVKAITVDGSNVYVTGGSMDSNLYYDFATVKYSSSGDSLWARRYASPGDYDDHAYSIAVDGGGNVYATGYGTGSGTGWDYATVKYNSSGAEQWVQTYTTTDQDYAVAIAVDGNGNVYVTGSSGDPYFMTWDYVTIKYDSSGVEQWVERYNGPADGRDEARAIAVDGSGNVYVTGYSDSSGTGADYATVKYSPAGVEEWVARYNGPANGHDDATAIALDGSGNVYVTGYSDSSGTGADYATVKYSPAGVEEWVARYNGPANGHDEARAIAVDASGNVYVTGSSDSSGTAADYATVKYGSSGVERWVQRYDGPGNDNDHACGIAVDGSANIYVTGESHGSGTDYDYATIKYSPTGVEEASSTLQEQGRSLLRCYPNPFGAGGTNIKFKVKSEKSKVSLKIYDITGRIVKTLVNEEKDAGSHAVSFDAKGLSAGVYFSKFAVHPTTGGQAGDYEETKKLILMR